MKFLPGMCWRQGYKLAFLPIVTLSGRPNELLAADGASGFAHHPWACHSYLHGGSLPCLEKRGRACSRPARKQLKVKALPLHWIAASDPMFEHVASMNACYPLSLAAAWIALLTPQIGTTLFHKNPEFRSIVDLSQEWLS